MIFVVKNVRFEVSLTTFLLDLFRVGGDCGVGRGSYFTLSLYTKQFEEFVSEGFAGNAVENGVDAVVEVLHDVHEHAVVRV